MWELAESETFSGLKRELAKIEKEYNILSYSFSRGRFCYSVMLEVELKEEIQ